MLEQPPPDRRSTRRGQKLSARRKVPQIEESDLTSNAADPISETEVFIPVYERGDGMETERSSAELVDDAVVGQFARAALLAALLGAVAPVAIPLPLSPAPITLQVLFVFLAGLLLGPVWGGISILLYLTAGAIGLPVFSGMVGGLGVLVGETGGYLWSYPIAAALVGLLVHGGTDLRDPADVSTPFLVGVLVAATILIYGMGTAYMAWLLELEVWEAITVGALPFIPGELLKMAAAIAIVKRGVVSPLRS
ncbi:hypothetical protein AArc1_2646 [Natrarchaeobaculum sulfurireducens]|uniref:Substrate-specific component BioY of biotin ECF transporter n=2 Tax=Natrarchaeobaculum sulfurireducens TaxID=2044521 RepID=A0A346PHG4_9EURY|nr:hypothetical protein AArc1_2646 [Natrarchaeobaculum sulfurireducens]